MKRIIFCLVCMLSVEVAVADEYFDEQIRQEYRDGYIERHNAEVRAYNDDSEYKAQMQELRRENMLNLYINSKEDTKP